MSISLEQLKDAMIDLPDDERAELLQYLVESVDGKNLDEVRKEWIAVAKVRLEELRSGRVQGIPASDVLQNLLKPRP